MVFMFGNRQKPFEAKAGVGRVIHFGNRFLGQNCLTEGVRERKLERI